MSLFEKVRDVIVGAIHVPETDILEETRMEDVEEWDSLGHVHIMIALEQTFELTLDVEDFLQLDGVPAILALLQSQNVE